MKKLTRDDTEHDVEYVTLENAMAEINSWREYTPMKKNVYTCKTFAGYYPVGTAAIVTAASQEKAAWLLNSELQLRGLPGDAKPEDMIPYPAGDPHDCRILTDGNY